MRQEMIQIPRKEYDKLKELEALKDLDAIFIKKVLIALKNFEAGKFKEWV